MGIFEAMLERNALHAMIPFLLGDERAAAEAKVAQLNLAIAQATIEEQVQ